MKNAILARYDGHCEICEGPIREGEDQIVNIDGDWCHETCAEEEGYE